MDAHVKLSTKESLCRSRRRPGRDGALPLDLRGRRALARGQALSSPLQAPTCAGHSRSGTGRGSRSFQEGIAKRELRDERRRRREAGASRIRRTANTPAAERRDERERMTAERLKMASHRGAVRRGGEEPSRRDGLRPIREQPSRRDGLRPIREQPSRRDGLQPEAMFHRVRRRLAQWSVHRGGCAVPTVGGRGPGGCVAVLLP